MDVPGASALCRRMGYAFNDAVLLTLALTHKSYSNENPATAPEHNERLEFLGDAVLDFVISDLLMALYPLLPEGELSKTRAGLVSEPALAQIARELQLGSCLRMGRGERISGGNDKDSILSDGLEALIAAVYLDGKGGAGGDTNGGIAAARRLIEGLYAGRLKSAGQPLRLVDHKTELQELVQKRHKDTVRYTILEEAGPDHAKEFEAAVVFRGQELARGRGRSKKQAEQEAAQAALAALSGNEDAP